MLLAQAVSDRVATRCGSNGFVEKMTEAGSVVPIVGHPTLRAARRGGDREWHLAHRDPFIHYGRIHLVGEGFAQCRCAVMVIFSNEVHS